MLHDGKIVIYRWPSTAERLCSSIFFPLRTSPQVSTSRSERVQRRSKKDAACSLDNVQYEIEVNSDEVVENIEIDHVVNCVVDSKEVQGTLLCSKQHIIENF